MLEIVPKNSHAAPVASEQPPQGIRKHSHVGVVWGVPTPRYNPSPLHPKIRIQAHQQMQRGKGGGAGRCLRGGERGGGGPGEGGRGSRGEGSPPPAEVNHIHQELQKCTTLTHSDIHLS